MSVYESHGRWYYNFMLFGIRKHGACRGCKTKTQAIEFEAEQKTELSLIYRGKKSEAEIITLKEMFDMLLEYAGTNNSESQKSQHLHNSKIMKDFFGANTKISEITPMLIEGFRKKLLSENLKKATINRYISTLSKAYNLIIIEKKLNIQNPCVLVSKFKEDNQLQRYLSKEEEKKLMKELSPHLRPIVVCALTTGMRLSNILNLRWEAIDFELGFIEVLKQENKGHKKIQIPLSKKLKDALVEIGIKKSGFVFINPKTGKPYTTIKTGFNKAVERANIPPIRFHDLRHTVGTRLVSKGADLQTVKELLAHSSISTTQRYLHPVNKNIKKAVDILDRF